MLLGSRVFTSSTMVSAARAGSLRRRKKKSCLLSRRSGSSPRLTPWALRTMALSAACRKISVRRTMGITPLRIRSENRLPGPTLGSWSGSPTRISRHSGRRADSRPCMRVISTMEVSSTITVSAFSGSLSSWANTSRPEWGSYWVSRRRWIVVPSAPHSSPSRLAARPVGAARAVSQPQGIEQGQHSTQGGGLAGARSAGEEHHLAGGGQLHCLALLWGIGDALLGLDAVDEFLQPMGATISPAASSHSRKATYCSASHRSWR